MSSVSRRNTSSETSMPRPYRIVRNNPARWPQNRELVEVSPNSWGKPRPVRGFRPHPLRLRANWSSFGFAMNPNLDQFAGLAAQGVAAAAHSPPADGHQDQRRGYRDGDRADDVAVA